MENCKSGSKKRVVVFSPHRSFPPPLTSIKMCKNLCRQFWWNIYLGPWFWPLLPYLMARCCGKFSLSLEGSEVADSQHSQRLVFFKNQCLIAKKWVGVWHRDPSLKIYTQGQRAVFSPMLSSKDPVWSFGSMGAGTWQFTGSPPSQKDGIYCH